MGEKYYKVRVERLNRLQTFLLICGLMGFAYSISYAIEATFGVIVRGELVLLVLLVLLCLIMTKWGAYFPTTIELEVEFKKSTQKFCELLILYLKVTYLQKFFHSNKIKFQRIY